MARCTWELAKRPSRPAWSASLREGDALALDHRGTPPLLMRGVDPVLLTDGVSGPPRWTVRWVGRPHAPLFPAHLTASSGIVGASGPAAAGFALAAQYLRPEAAAVAFFGEGAMNQGMLMEAMNLAVVWKLPVLFVCKDNEWAITTPASSRHAAKLVERARGFGMPGRRVDGSDVEAVWDTTDEALERARAGDGPTFIHAQCVHLEGIFWATAAARGAPPGKRDAANGGAPVAGYLWQKRGAYPGTL